MIEGISSITSITPKLSQIISTNKTSVPVKPSFSVYARFKHFIGVPSRDRGAQVPVSKLRILDSLIERIVKLRNGSGDKFSIEKIDESNIDPMINSLEQELRSSIMAQKPSFSGLYPETGMLVNTFA